MLKDARVNFVNFSQIFQYYRSNEYFRKIVLLMKVCGLLKRLLNMETFNNVKLVYIQTLLMVCVINNNHAV